MPQLVCDKLTLGYGGKLVLSNLSFEIDSGNYLCVIGENGSGKSTLIKALLGLQTPVFGHIAWGNGVKRTEIGYLPQQTVIQRDFPASVAEVVQSGCLSKSGWRPLLTRDEKVLVEKNMTWLGVQHLAKHCYRELSGGQQQRVLLARALCATHSVLILDEPVTGLDPDIAAELYALIAGLNVNGITIIMISHDLNAVSHASHVLRLGADRFFGTTDDYLKSGLVGAYCG